MNCQINKTVLLGASVLMFLLIGSNISAQAPAYKRFHRDLIAEIVDGDTSTAIEQSFRFLQEHPADEESLFVLAIAYTVESDLAKANHYARKAIDAGLPVERFLAGPRELLQPLISSEGFCKLVPKGTPRLLHGPLLGCVTDHSASIWVRTDQQVPVQALIDSDRSMDSAQRSESVRTDPEKDFTGIIPLDDLAPATRYYYKMRIDGQTLPRTYSFTTFPRTGQPAEFSIVFGGGAGYTPQNEKIWQTIESENPLALLLLGDNVYIDHPTYPAVQQYCYYRRQSQPQFRSLVASASVFAIYDDHDFGDDDCFGGPRIDEPAWKMRVWKLFRDQWNNPYYGGGTSQPGCWFDFSIADVDFFMLDGRYYRQKGLRQGVKKQNPSMLGPAQKKWLFEKLKNSKATFKVIASPVPWAKNTKPGIAGYDTWDGFENERKQIFSFLHENRIEGVLLLSADRHRSDLWKIERPDGYRLYECESSRLTNAHYHPKMPGCVFSYNEKCSFAMLTFDTAAAEAVKYKIFNIDGKKVFDFTISKSQLSYHHP